MENIWRGLSKVSPRRSYSYTHFIPLVLICKEDYITDYFLGANSFQSFSFTLTPNFLAAFLIFSKASFRSSSVTSFTWSNLASALRTCDAFERGSLRFFVDAYFLSDNFF